VPSIARVSTTAVALMIGLAMTSWAGTESSPAHRLLAPYGLKQFPDLYRRALEAFLTAEKLYQNGDYGGALKGLEQLWAQYPPGSEDWARCNSSIAGINIGSPPCYYGLRMLTDCAQWRLQRGAQRSRQGRPRMATLTVVLVGRSKGIQPTSWAELEKNTGREVEHVLHPMLLAHNQRVIHQSLRLFREYVLAMTEGRLGVRTEVLYLPDLCVPVHAVAAPYRVAELADGAMDQMWAAIPPEVVAATDWWWVLYPSHVPEQYPGFETTEFITGGMGRGPDGASPCFIIDDLWLVRKPPHLGRGPYSEWERRAYLPQWLQHEFFHHLFACYPEFELEAKDHQWFNHETWPKDFEGRFEADYFYEALHKRLQPLGNPPLHVTLRYAAPPQELFSALTTESLYGTYRHRPVENDWHVGTIQPDAEAGRDGTPVLRWTNTAGVSWRLWPALKEGVLRTGPDNPYYESNPTNGRAFRIVLRRDSNGEYVSEVAGFQFQEGFYGRETP